MLRRTSHFSSSGLSYLAGLALLLLGSAGCRHPWCLEVTESSCTIVETQTTTLRHPGRNQVEIIVDDPQLSAAIQDGSGNFYLRQADVTVPLFDVRHPMQPPVFMSGLGDKYTVQIDLQLGMLSFGQADLFAMGAGRTGQSKTTISIGGLTLTQDATTPLPTAPWVLQVAGILDPNMIFAVQGVSPSSSVFIGKKDFKDFNNQNITLVGNPISTTDDPFSVALGINSTALSYVKVIDSTNYRLQIFRHTLDSNMKTRVYESVIQPDNTMLPYVSEDPAGRFVIVTSLQGLALVKNTTTLQPVELANTSSNDITTLSADNFDGSARGQALVTRTNGRFELLAAKTMGPVDQLYYEDELSQKLSAAWSAVSTLPPRALVFVDIDGDMHKEILALTSWQVGMIPQLFVVGQAVDGSWWSSAIRMPEIILGKNQDVMGLSVVPDKSDNSRKVYVFVGMANPANPMDRRVDAVHVYRIQ